MMLRVAPLLALLPSFSLAVRAALEHSDFSQDYYELTDNNSFHGHASGAHATASELVSLMSSFSRSLLRPLSGPAPANSPHKDWHEEPADRHEYQELHEYAWMLRPEMLPKNGSHKDVDEAPAQSRDVAALAHSALPESGGFALVSEKVVPVVQLLAPYRFTVMGLLICFVFYVSAGGATPPIFIVQLCFSYSSISMSMLNKHAAGIFPYTALLVALQMLCTVLVLLLVEGRHMKVGRTVDILRWAVTTLLYTGVLASGLWALKATTLSTVIVLRNILPLFTLFAEKVWLKLQDAVTVPVISSLLLMAGGTFIYAHDNMSVSREAAGYILLNCVFVVLDRIVQRRLLMDPEFSLSPSVCMLVNSGLGMLIMALLALGNGELWLWPSALQETGRETWFWICLTGINGCVLGYVGVQCQKMVSATSFLVLQNATKVVLILLSVAIFRDHITGVSLAGAALSMLGSAWYGSLRLPAAASQRDGSVPTSAACCAAPGRVPSPAPSSSSLDSCSASRGGCPRSFDEDSSSDSTVDTRQSRH